MVFHVYPATPVLQPFIKGYLVADSSLSKETRIHKLFPNGYSGVFFNFGNLGKLLIKEEHKTPKVSIFGQIDQYFDAIHLPGSYSIGVLFEPTVLYKILRINMSEFTNKACDGMTIKPELGFLYEQLEMAPLEITKIDLLNQYFTRALVPSCLYTTPVDHAVRLINENRTLSIQKLALKLGLSERYLEAQFKNELGLSPKKYSMIVRFKRIEQCLTSTENVKWGKMDFALEFYDQNHFIKNFKRFTGHTPSDYLMNNLEMGRSYMVK